MSLENQLSILVLMSAVCCMELWDCYIVHLKLIQHCGFTILEFKMKISLGL